MISKKSTFFLGIFIFLIPFFGFPSSWKTVLVIACGLLVISLSVKITIPKKIPKARARKEKITPVFVESSPIFPSNNTLERSRSVGDLNDIK